MPRRNRNQHDLDRAVASATCEDLRVIRRRGFSLIDLRDHNFDPEADQRPPLVIDWDGLEAHRAVQLRHPRRDCLELLA